MARAKGSRGTEKPVNRVISYEQVVAAGRVQFLRDGTVNLDRLAAELAVSRATMYRLVEGRDRVLGDVLWSFAEPMLEQITGTTRARGFDAIIEVSVRFYQAILRAAPFRHFLSTEPEAAVRVLFTPAGGVHERAIRQQIKIFRTIQERDGIELREDLESLAYLYVRIAESLLYADLLSGRAPDLRLVERAARAVLTQG